MPTFDLSRLSTFLPVANSLLSKISIQLASMDPAHPSTEACSALIDVLKSLHDDAEYVGLAQTTLLTLHMLHYAEHLDKDVQRIDQAAIDLLKASHERLLALTEEVELLHDEQRSIVDLVLEFERAMPDSHSSSHSEDPDRTATYRIISVASDKDPDKTGTFALIDPQGRPLDDKT